MTSDDHQDTKDNILKLLAMPMAASIDFDVPKLESHMYRLKDILYDRFSNPSYKK